MSKKIKEPLSLKIKKKWMKSKPTTILLVLILITAFVALNLWIKSIDLAQIDVTENKIYSLTEKSIDFIKDIKQKVKIYAYGYSENNSLIDLLKQYCRENENITYEILKEESNKGKIEEYGLTNNYQTIIVEIEERSTIISQSEFFSYDYTTGQQIDLTEQKITNTIINLAIKNKPKVYMLSGHNEYPENALAYLSTNLKNEAYECSTINLLTQKEIPADCDILLIMSPQKDFIENETNMIINYINNGGNVIFTQDTLDGKKEYPNYQKILDLYGLEFENGYVYETSIDSALSGAPYIIMPKVNEYHDITSQIFSDGGVVFPFAKKIKKADEEHANTLNTEYEVLLTSTDESYYITDLYSEPTTVLGKSEKGSFDLAVIATKTINPEAEKEKQKQSKILVVGNGIFILDTQLNGIQDRYASQLGSNLDFMMNSIAYLTERTDSITIRKEMNSSTYSPTTVQQDIIVKSIIFGIPSFIILAGIVVWNRRKKKR